MDVDAAPVLKRKGADASELWLDDDGPGFPVAFRATKSRRLERRGGAASRARRGRDAAAACSDARSRGGGEEERRGCAGAVAGRRRPRLPRHQEPPPGRGHAACRAAPPPPQTQPVAGVGAAEAAAMCGDVAVVPVGMAAPAANDERAIVLYRPAEAARSLLLGPLRPGAPLRVSPDWIHGLKGTMLQETSNHRALFAGDENSKLAMVPWAPSRVQAPSTAATAATATEMMDAEDTSMDVEQDRAGQPSTTHQWPQQQQHCMVQQPIPAASYQPSPVTWSW